MTLLERFSSKVEITMGCWLWLASCTPNGYGKFNIWSSRLLRKQLFITAHRFSYMIHRGIIPKDLCVDHLCRNKSCVNPWHMELVTNWENTMRANNRLVQKIKRQLATTSCPQGHPYNEQNTYRRSDNPRKRDCKMCRSIRNKEFKFRAIQHGQDHNS